MNSPRRQRTTAASRMALSLLLGGGLAAGSLAAQRLPLIPAPPAPEPVRLEALPLPPTAPTDAEGACTRAINPHGTGCISAAMDGIIEGPAYSWDTKHVLLPVQFTGAPAGRDAASIYTGPQVIAIRTDGGTFANGDAWKCITCGVPAANRQGANAAETDGGGRKAPAGSDWIRLDHPQAFPGDRKMIAGTNVVDCGPYRLTDADCTPDRIRIVPIRWNSSAKGTGQGGSMRELRLNPDGAHLMWSHMTRTPSSIDQHGLVGRIVFNPAPKSGEPRVPRYELTDVFVLTSTDRDHAPFKADPRRSNRLIQNPSRGVIGEARGWTRDGRGAVGLGTPESGNVDMYATDIKTGHSRRLTSAPGYADPILMSPDDRWFVVFDNRGVDRHMYYGAMQGIPPLIDQLTRMVMLSAQYGYRNGLRRFFQPYLVDRWGDRGSYAGQQLNAGSGEPGSPSDPNWNARADPAWSPDGTAVVYWQALVTAPACGGPNPLPCPVSTEPGSRRTRLMIARLPSRKPLAPRRAIAPRSIAVPWGTRYRAGDAMPNRAAFAPAGKFTLAGRQGGSAQVEIREASPGRISYVAARYDGYSDDGIHVIDGTESAEVIARGQQSRIVWHSDLRSSGRQIGTKKTIEPGGFVMSPMGQPLEGELVTTIDGKTYRPPRPGT
ncbi:MAG: hypothetical protein EOP13_00115 [Pseudomonas sp.]|uniref:TolB family protein n=1 Tax=Pseudomonas sp. TaxID=306 RepID=UPI001209C0F1|nr:hypothetical protein [Pseudomonas sp.]RZI76931.1 MAG: hypothetical protein EOP13_00115 [Pseudomonas sp.]